MGDRIPLFEIPWDVDDIHNVVDSVGRGGYWAKGPYVSEFEERLEAYLGVDHALVVNSGTTGIIAALKALNVGGGDEVIVPSFTQQATVNAVAFLGAEPVFADIERETYGLDPQSVREQITEDVVAILPVHVYGSVCDIRRLVELGDEFDIHVVEDAAEALGARRDGGMAGTFGEAGAFSFCQNKIVPTGEGGAVVTDNDELAKSVELYRSHGRTTEDYFASPKSGRHVAVGGNFRMPDIVAALGCSQMAKIETLISGRREAASHMNEEFRETQGVIPHLGSGDGRHVYQFYTVTFDPEVDRDGVIDILDDEAISSKVYWDPPVHESEFYRRHTAPQPLPVTEELSSRVLALPIHPELATEERERIVAGVKKAIKASG